MDRREKLNTDMNLPAFLLKLVLKKQNFLIKY